jgi:hypothetical protein
MSRLIRLVAVDRSIAAIDGVWWGVWWPWLLVWGITAVSLVAAVTIAIAHWHRHRAPTPARLPGISFYLDKSVMELYQQYGDKNKGALRQEVEERFSSNRDFKLSFNLPPVEGSGTRGDNREVSNRYTTYAKPITVIRTIIDIFDKTNDIVDIDLRKQEVPFNDALAKAVNADDKKPTTVRLHDLETFVLIRGVFRRTDCTAEVITFEAPYGDPADPADGPQVHLSCKRSGLRGKVEDVPSGRFQARCFGRIEAWNPDTRRLIVYPIAIFR